MIKKIYIDNYKCHSNFELTLNQINLLLGPNGTGKSSLFEVLGKLQRFLTGEKAEHVFSASDLTRWTTLRTHGFELQIAGNNGAYRYELSIQFTEDSSPAPKIEYERLWFDQIPLVQFEKGKVAVSYTGAEVDVEFPLIPTQSAITLLPTNKETEKIQWFRRYVGKIIVVQVVPPLMEGISRWDEPYLNKDSRNFTSWYRSISKNQGLTIQITQELQQILPGFSHFEFLEYGEQRQQLVAKFSAHNGKRDEINFAFHQLSDGQRALIALYSLIHFAESTGCTLCLDEPENFLALPEIQPWLIKLYDASTDGAFQSILISHHPELINYLAASQGIWFERTINSSVRVKPIVADNESGLKISELIARGWLHG